MKIILYATSDYGDGYVSQAGTFNDLSEIRIRVGIYKADVVLTLEECD